MELVLKNESYAIIGAAFEVYNHLGSGYLESVYQEALALEFENQTIPFLEHPKVEIFYKEIILKQHYIPDFLCHSEVIIEIKAAKTLCDEHRAQAINYLKSTNHKLAILLNFGNPQKLEYERLIL